MFASINERIIAEAEYLIENECTIRVVGKYFGLSKSTVHKDLSDKLYFINEKLYLKVRKILSFNLSERHIRGGMATKIKFMNLSKKVN